MSHRTSSSASSSSSGSGSSSGFGGGSTQINYENNVDQDISHLAARTHAEQGGSISHTGRRRMMSQQDGEAPRPDLVTGVSTLERVAQGGHGFQTVGLDLGVVGSRHNVDEEMRRQSAGVASGQASSQASGGTRTASSSYESHSSSGGRQDGGSSKTYGSSFTSNTGGGYDANDHNADDYNDEEEVDYDENDADQGQGAGQGSSWRKESSYSFSHHRPLNAHHDRIDQQFKHYPAKREIKHKVKREIIYPGFVGCQSLHCLSVRCVVGPLDKNVEALIALRTRLVAHTLDKVS